MGFIAGLNVHVVVGNIAVMWLLRQLVPAVSCLSRMWAASGASVAVAEMRATFPPSAVPEQRGS